MYIDYAHKGSTWRQTILNVTMTKKLIEWKVKNGPFSTKLEMLTFWTRNACIWDEEVDDSAVPLGWLPEVWWEL